MYTGKRIAERRAHLLLGWSYSVARDSFVDTHDFKANFITAVPAHTVTTCS